MKNHCAESLTDLVRPEFRDSDSGFDQLVVLLRDTYCSAEEPNVSHRILNLTDLVCIIGIYDYDVI